MLAALYRLPTGKRHASPWLAALSAAMLLRTLPLLLAFAGVPDHQGWLLLAPCDLALLWGPLLHEYLARVTDQRPAPPSPWHYAPGVLHLAYQIAWLLLPLERREAWYFGPHTQLVAPIIAAAQLISLSLYASAAWRTALAWRRRDANAAWSFDEPWDTWALRAVLGGIALATFAAALLLLVHLFVVPMIYLNRLPIALAYAASTYLVTVIAARMARTPPAPLTVPAPHVPSDAAHGAAHGAAQRAYVAQAEAWRQRLVRERWHHDPSLTLGSLAQRLHTSERTLSRTLREGMGVTFSSLVNQLRVEDAVRRLAEPDAPTVLEVAFAVGFASKASFHRAFKRHTGGTPTQCRPESRSQLPPIAELAEGETTG